MKTPSSCYAANLRQSLKHSSLTSHQRRHGHSSVCSHLRSSSERTLLSFHSRLNDNSHSCLQCCPGSGCQQIGSRTFSASQDPFLHSLCALLSVDGGSIWQRYLSRAFGVSTVLMSTPTSFPLASTSATLGTCLVSYPSIPALPQENSPTSSVGSHLPLSDAFITPRLLGNRPETPGRLRGDGKPSGPGLSWAWNNP